MSNRRPRDPKYRKKWLSARYEAGICSHCRGLRDSEQPRCAACRDKKRRYDEDRYRRGLADHQILKREIFEAYGGAICACCGETHIEFLTLDHVNGGGCQHRKALLGSRTGGHFYRSLKALGFPNDPPLRVLCLNCNWSIGHYGYCPHD